MKHMGDITRIDWRSVDVPDVVIGGSPCQGFPYLWEQINGKGSALWASEIDSFCVRVTECRINGG